jgi:hypothetical protein
MSARKSPDGLCDAGASLLRRQEKQASQRSSKSHPPQARAGVSRRWNGEHWVSPSLNTALASALIEAARAANAGNHKAVPADGRNARNHLQSPAPKSSRRRP